MKKSLLFLIPLAFLSGCINLKSDRSAVIARFDGDEITERQFLTKIKALPKAVQAMASQRKKDLVEDMVAEHYLLKEAQKRGIGDDPEVKDLMEAAKKKILMAKLVEKEVDAKIGVDAEEVAKYYEFHREEFMTPLLLRASHILVKTKEEAEAIKAQLEAGADFEEMARLKSTDATALRGGDLGFFQRGQFVPEFEEAVFSMKKGELRGPIKTTFGYHIIKLNDRMEPRLRELKAVQSLVEERLVQDKRSRIFKDYIQKIKGNAKVAIDEKALEKIAL